MAKGRRNSTLAGLAALGTLGYILSQRGKGADTGTGGVGAQAAKAMTADAGPSITDAQREAARRSGEDISEGERVSSIMANRPAPVRAEAPARSMARATPQSQPDAALSARGGARSTGRGGATVDELEAYERQKRMEPMRGRGYNRADAPATQGRPYSPPPMTEEMRRQAEGQAIKRVYPEEYLVGGPGLKTLHTAAKALAARTGRTAESSVPFLKELPGPAGRSEATAALPSPTPRLSGPSKSAMKESERATRSAQRESERLRENAERYGLNPNAPGYDAAARALRENLGGKDFMLKKKGGAIKAAPKKMASGGMTSKVSTASKRADGIASKGKTRCKMY